MLRLALLFSLALLVGCGSDSGTVPVTGTIKFSDGTVPQGEISVIRFEPVGAGVNSKAASGDIQPDGSFTLTTMEQGDGAFPGEYKVTTSVFKTYAGREELVASQFTKAETTPLSATVKDGGEPFTFTVEKAK